MNEYEKVFKKNFLSHIDDPIALYGLGINAERIINNVHCFDFECLVALDHIGEEKYGLRVRALEDAIKKVKVIIIAASPNVKRIIYDRIKDDVPGSIKIYDIWGKELRDLSDVSNNPYWNKSSEELKKEIDKHDIISFDMFDTLVMRKSLNVENFFEYVELNLRKKGFEGSFKEMRIHAEAEAISERSSPKLADIYRHMSSIYGIDEDTNRQLMKAEINYEIDNLVPRQTIKGIYEYALSKGKGVVIASDTYYGKDVFEDILRRCGYAFPNKLYLSCEEGKTKETGLLYDLIDKGENDHVLHIGDNYLTDYEIPEGKNIDAYYIMNGIDMLRNSACYHIENHVGRFEERLLLGKVISDLFNDPFSLGEGKGRITIRKAEMLGEICTGALALSFLDYLLHIVKNVDCEILFSSRDSYYFYRIYETRISRQIKKLPKSHYFYISRNAVCRATVKNIDILKKYLLYAEENYNVKLFFSERFGVELPEEYSLSFGEAKKKWGDNWVEEKVGGEFEVLFSEQGLNRASLIKYIDRLGVRNAKQIIFVDMVTKGTCLFGLNQVINNDTKLVALGGIELPNEYIRVGESDCLYGNNATGTEFYQWFTVLELLMASTEDQCIGYYDGDPKFIPGTGYNSELLEKAQRGMEALCELFDDIGWEHLHINKEMAEDMLKLLDSECSDITDELLDEFTSKDSLWVPGESVEGINVLKKLR